MVASGGYRYTYERVLGTPQSVSPFESTSQFEELCGALRQEIIGQNAVTQTPFGLRRILYADYTASGRSVSSVEDFMLKEVLPYYGNTHSVSTSTALQTTAFRMEARQIIKQYYNATHEDALIFCGSGCTAAVQKFIAIMERSQWSLPEEGQSAARDVSAVGDSDLEAELTRKSFFKEDRWGSCECTLCGVRLKNEALYRAHAFSTGHMERLRALSTKTPPDTHKEAGLVEELKGEIPQNVSPTASGIKKRRMRLVLFLCDPTAHHSLLLPFRELATSSRSSPLSARSTSHGDVDIFFDTVDLQLNPKTLQIDQDHLEKELGCYQQLKKSWKEGLASTTLGGCGFVVDIVVIAVLSAGSNITGVAADIERLTALVHRYGAIACWDFAAVSAHNKVDFNPPSSAMCGSLNCSMGLDVGFFSPHKLLGGPGAPGILLIKKCLLRNSVPSCPGGGVVFYVSKSSHSYIHNTEEREEGGTPDILADIRCGLVYRLHTFFPLKDVAARESQMRQMLVKALSKHPRITLLGAEDEESATNRMGIVSFLVRYGNIPISGQQEGLYLHHNFVVLVLNDVFGIQARGGCACAGPFAQALLGFSFENVRRMEECLERTGNEVLRPGFVRVSLHFTMGWDEVTLLIRGILWVADHGWKLLPAYTFVAETGEWEHCVFKPHLRRRWLSGLAVSDKSSQGEKSSLEICVDSRRGLQGTNTTEALLPSSQENIALCLRKDPKRVKGAVPLLQGLDKDVILGDDLQETLIKTRAGLRKTRVNIPLGMSPVSGDGQRESHREPKGVQRPELEDTGTDAPLDVSGLHIAGPAQDKSATAGSGFVETLLREAERVVASETRNARTASFAAASESFLLQLPEDCHDLVWFALPIDAMATLEATPKDVVPVDVTQQLVAKGTSGIGQPRCDAAFFSPGRGDLVQASNIRGTLEAVGAALVTWGKMITTSRNPMEPENDVAVHLGRLLEAARNIPSTLQNGGPVHTLQVCPGNKKTESSSGVFSESPALSPTGEKTDAGTLPDVRASGERFLVIPRDLRRSVGSAIRDFGMIREGDRLLLGVSGGKDSLTLLHVLRDAQRRSPVKFHLAAATVDPQTPEYNPRPLIDYMAILGVPYHFLSYPLIDIAKSHMQKNSICAFCSRMKRGILYSCMRKHKYNVLVLGQHLDDICESFVMSAFHNGCLNTMKAHYTVLARFAAGNKLPVIPDNCPACFSHPKERHRVKLLLAQQEFEFPHIFQTLLKTVRPLIAIDNVIQKPQNENDGKTSSLQGVDGTVSEAHATAEAEYDAVVHWAQELVDGKSDHQTLDPKFAMHSEVRAVELSSCELAKTVQSQDLAAEGMLSACAMYSGQNAGGSCCWKGASKPS